MFLEHSLYFEVIYYGNLVDEYINPTGKHFRHSHSLYNINYLKQELNKIDKLQIESSNRKRKYRQRKCNKLIDFINYLSNVWSEYFLEYDLIIEINRCNVLNFVSKKDAWPILQLSRCRQYIMENDFSYFKPIKCWCNALDELFNVTWRFRSGIGIWDYSPTNALMFITPEIEPLQKESNYNQQETLDQNFNTSYKMLMLYELKTVNPIQPIGVPGCLLMYLSFNHFNQEKNLVDDVDNTYIKFWRSHFEVFLNKF